MLGDRPHRSSTEPGALHTDLDDLQTLNDVQAEFFAEPHPPRSTYGIAGLPHERIEMTAVAKRR